MFPHLEALVRVGVGIPHVKVKIVYYGFVIPKNKNMFKNIKKGAH
jgi:hypothetical protein